MILEEIMFFGEIMIYPQNGKIMIYPKNHDLPNIMFRENDKFRAGHIVKSWNFEQKKKIMTSKLTT